MISDVTGGPFVISYPSTYLVDVNKYHASQFYNWEQDNIPIDDLETRTDTLGAAIGLFEDGIAGTTMTLANTEVSANSIYGSIDNIIKLIPKTITFPILVEITTYGNLGDLVLENITLKGNGKLEFINRNYATAVKGDTNHAVTDGTATITYFPWGDELITSALTSQKIVGDIAGAASTNTLNSSPACFDKDEWNKYSRVISYKDLSTNTAITEPLFHVSGGGVVMLDAGSTSDYGFSGSPYYDVTTSSDDSNPAEFGMSGQTSFRGSTYRTAPVATDIASPTYVYGNWFNSVKVENCRGSQIQIKGFCVDGVGVNANEDDYHANAVGFDIQNSDVVLTSCAAVRNADVGFRIDNSNVLVEGGLVGYRNYPFDGSSRTPVSGETEYDIWNLDYKGHGFEAYRSHITFDPDSNLDNNATGTDSFLGKHGFIMSNNGGDGWRFDNCRISGGVGGHTGTGEQGAGPVDYQTTQIIGAFNKLNGINLINSNSAYKGLLRAQGNETNGVTSNKSKVACMGVVSELNESIGLNIKSSEFVYNYGANDFVTAYDSNNVNWHNRAGHSLLTPAISIQDNGTQNIKIFNNSTFENEYMDYQSRRSGLVGGRGKPSYSWAMQAANGQGGAPTTIHSHQKFNLPLISVDHNSYARLLGLSVFGDINPLNSGSNTADASAGVKGRALSVTDNSQVDLYGTSAYCTVLTNERDYTSSGDLKDSWNKSAVYAGNSSKVRISGPTKISQFGVAALAENNSVIEIGPPLDNVGAYDPGLYDFNNLNDGNGHTMVDIQGTRSCLVVNDKSTLDISKCGVGVSSDSYTFNTTSKSTVDDIYHASSYVQLYPNGFTEEAYSDDGGKYCDQDWRTKLTTPGKFNRLTMGFDSSTSPTKDNHVSSTTGGMCVRAVGGSNVILDQVTFEVHLGCTDTSGAYYNIAGSANEGVGLYHGSSSDTITADNMFGTATEHYGGSQIHMWNIADTSRIVASNLQINNVDGSAAGYHGPTGQWGSGAAYDYNLGPLDYYGSGGIYIEEYSAATNKNFGPFRLMVGVNTDLMNYCEGTVSGVGQSSVNYGHNSAGPKAFGGTPIAQINSQGYAAPGAFAIPIADTDYRAHQKIEGLFYDDFTLTTSNMAQPIFGGRPNDLQSVTNNRKTLSSPMLIRYDSYKPDGSTHTSATTTAGTNFPLPPLHMEWQGYLRNFLDESASDVFANAKHGASKMIKLCSIFRSNTNPLMGGEGRDGDGSYTFGKGCRSLNLFDLDKLI
jgi:hypothetical protein